MRKHTILKIILEAPDSVTAMEISKKLEIALPNIYTYLNELYYDDLISKSNEGKYKINKTNVKELFYPTY